MPSSLSRPLLCALVRYEQPLALLGLYYLSTRVFHVALSAVSGLRYYVLAQWLPSAHLSCYGQWAVVNLADNTLSYYYAEELARKHMNIQLVGVDTENGDLKNFAEHLQGKYNIRAHVIRIDPDGNRDDVLGCLQAEIESLDSIGLLVNQLPARPLSGPHELLSDCDLTDQIQALLLTAHITKVVMRKMAAVGRGAIVNIGDPSGEYPHAYLASYSAASAYMDTFSRSLRWEMSCHNVRVQSLVPYPCVRASSDPCTLTAVRPRALARHAVNTLGKARSRGNWWYGVRGYVASCLPLCWRQYWHYIWNRPECDCKSLE